MKKFSLVGICIIIAISSCVPKRQLISSQGRVRQLQSDSSGTHNLLNECNANLKECNTTASHLLQQKDSVGGELQNLSSSSQMTINDQAKRLKDLQTVNSSGLKLISASAIVFFNLFITSFCD